MTIGLGEIAVTADEMRRVEERIFLAGMPVAALMEKAAGMVARRIQELYPRVSTGSVGVLVGPGHNGGDALVVARELHFAGYRVVVHCPFDRLKDLTAQHAQYVKNLGIEFLETREPLRDCSLLIDGLFGFGLERALTGKIAELVDEINGWGKSIVSIDIPSGIHTDTGEVLGTAIIATRSFCLGLWKRAFFQDNALPYLGAVEKLDFGIPPADVAAIVGNSSPVSLVSRSSVRDWLPLPRPLLTHKYRQGHLLLICGSRRYAGGAILSGLGARGSGVGMLSIAVPTSLKPLLVSHLPEALIIDCPETETGAIADIPADLSFYGAIACGPGLTLEARAVVERVLEIDRPVVLDADGLNILAELGIERVLNRREETVLTPHSGEFKRLFPELSENKDRIEMTREAARKSGSIVLLKGARTVIGDSTGKVRIIPESTPALARGGSGDILTGLIGGWLVQMPEKAVEATAAGAYLHARAGILAAEERTEAGVDGVTLANYLANATGEALATVSPSRE
ncbi:NAD(P)H-hydrate dehydratase [Pannus brasiliensis CCIBt3594]|uniref:Bifunctional NAD(P)H-hydrate repair enzyme n=1 Tax=Pannus brasiliensis CCIBt3594 TaxID=1427578 RepID=A0AAW9QNZ0_9CHRO